MSGDFESFSERSSQNWFSRLGSAIGGALIGILLFLVSFPLLYWNESRAVDTARALEEVGGNVKSVSSDRVDPAYDNKPVHTTGLATTDETLADDTFGVRANALRLVRTVEMYQWREDSKSETKKKLGGGQETVTTYTHRKDWSATPIDSSAFHKNPETGGRPSNPTWPAAYKPKEISAQKVTLGAFTLSPGLVRQITATEPLPVTEDDRAQLSAEAKADFTVADGGFYKGEAPGSPEVGDLRVKFAVVKPATVSILAEQTGGTFRAYQPKSASHTIEVLHLGNKSAAEMVATEQASNATLTWILRLVGFIIMALGIFLVMNPLAVFTDVLPFLGNLVGLVLGLFAAMTAAALTLVTIAVSWIAVRPVLGISLLAVAAAGAVGAVLLLRARRAARPAPR